MYAVPLNHSYAYTRERRIINRTIVLGRSIICKSSGITTEFAVRDTVKIMRVPTCSEATLGSKVRI